VGRHSFYQCKENEPRFLYPVPYIIYDMYAYDFERKVWRYVPS
jgi:hypothetical protein